MTKDAAQAILNEAERDRRITASLDTTYARADLDRGYQVRVTLRRTYTLLVRRADDWSPIKAAWSGL